MVTSRDSRAAGPVGLDLPRVDGPAKAAGTARYVDDLQPQGCLFGAVVRSDRPHARILGIERDPDFDWSDVVVVTAEDVPGENVVALMTDDQPALASRVVRHVEEPVALVAAPTRARAREAARHLRVRTEDLPALLDPEAAVGSEVVVYDPGPRGEPNVFARITIERDLDAPLPDDLVWVEGEYRTGRHEQLYLEPQGIIAIPRDDGGVTAIGSLQCPYYVLEALRRLLGTDRVNVVQAATGGGFGGKEEYPSMMAAHAALLARKAGRPVKIVYRRDEDLRATTKRHPSRVRIRAGVDRSGRIRRWEADVLLDGGAYNTLTPVVLSRAVLHVTGPYRCDSVRIHGVAVATHTPPSGAFRGFGAPQAHWAAERHLDRIARTLGIDPIELRRRNLLRHGDRTASGQVLDHPGAEAVLEEALRAAEAPLPPRRRLPGGPFEASLRHGRGVSLAFHGGGFTGNGEAWLRARVALELRGDTVHLLVASTDMGQGSETTLVQIVAAELGIPARRVVVDPHDTDRVPNSGPTVASRTCMVVGRVAQEAARRLVDALRAETGLGEDAGFDALLAARPSREPLRVEHAYEDDGSMKWDPERYLGDAYPAYGWSCAVVDLDVDVDTGEVVYRRAVTATDVGRAINPVVVRGQIEGGTLQALGFATMEEVVVDARGGMANARLANYAAPTAADAPPMVTRIVEIPYAGGPFGAKGIGELPMDGPAAAVAQAIERATGAVLDALPMTPERVLEAIGRAGEG